MVKRAKTVSTVLILPKPQLRCTQKPLLVSTTRDSTCCLSSFPAATSFSNSSFISATLNSPALERMTLLGRYREKTKRNCRPDSATARRAGRLPRKPARRRVDEDYPRASRPRTRAGIDLWGRPLAGHSGLVDRAKNRRSHSKERPPDSLASRSLPDFLARTHPRPRGRA